MHQPVKSIMLFCELIILKMFLGLLPMTSPTTAAPTVIRSISATCMVQSCSVITVLDESASPQFQELPQPQQCHEVRPSYVVNLRFSLLENVGRPEAYIQSLNFRSYDSRAEAEFQCYVLPRELPCMESQDMDSIELILLGLESQDSRPDTRMILGMISILLVVFVKFVLCSSETKRLQALYR